MWGHCGGGSRAGRTGNRRSRQQLLSRPPPASPVGHFSLPSRDLYLPWRFSFRLFFRWGKLKLNLPTQFPNLPVTAMRGLFLPNSTAQCLTHRIRGRKSSERKRGRVGGAYTRKVHSVARLTGAATEWRHNL